MVLQFYGSRVSLARIRELAKTTVDGTSALGLMEAAKVFYFHTKAFAADESLFVMEDVPYPLILHVQKEGNLLHYVVIYKASKGKLWVADPNEKVEIQKIAIKDFVNEWTGVALVITPTPNYSPQKEDTSELASFYPLLLKQKSLIFNIVTASFLVTIINILGSFYLQEVIDNYLPNQLQTTLGFISFGLIVVYVI
ncbi:MAG: hypothetical protein LBS28_02200 [Streptococcaceae bacterium]|jgi:ATP-binding cassette subfamily C protein|nr:hypothetical protein [Streptococcaceae bacterium]